MPPCLSRLHQLCRLFVATLGLTLALSLSARADAPTVLYILDGSGSMWGRLDDDKTPKVTLSAAAIRKSLGKIPPGANVGLVSFGHRRKGDCSDVEVLADPAPLGDGGRITEPADKLSPKGKGPLTAALRGAVEAIGARKPAGIVMIHDNADNCREDICAAAAEIAKTNPTLGVYTVGIALEPEEAGRMRCLAKETHGRMFEPADSVQLAAAIEEATVLALRGNDRAPAPAAAAAKPTPVPATPGVTPGAAPSPLATGTSGVHAVAMLTAGGDPLQVPMTWRIAREPESPGTTIDVTAPELWQALEPGSYRVAARTGFVTATASLTVAAGAVASLSLPFEAGLVRFGVGALKPAGATADMMIAITPTGSSTAGPTQLKRHPRGTDLVMPAGTYQLSIDGGRTPVVREIAVTAGATLALEAVPDLGRLALRAIVREDVPPLDDVVFVIAVDDPDQPQGRREIARSAAPRPAFDLPSGTYYVSARLGEAEGRRLVAVKAGDSTVQTILLPAAQLKLTASIEGGRAASGPRPTAIVSRLDGGPEREVARSLSERSRFVLAPGRYRVTALAGQQNANAQTEIELKPGTETEVALKITAGQIAFRTREPAGTADGFWEIADPQGHIIWRTLAAEPSTLLAPGRYVVRARFGERKLEQAFEVMGSESRVVTLGPP